MAECKWCKDEFCVNSDCPICADYCPVPDNEGVCKYEERTEQEAVKCKDCEYLMFSDCYGECSKAYKGIVSPDDSCGKGKRRTKKDR